MKPNTKVIINDYASPIKPTWCPGCGDFAIWTAIKMALVELNIPPTEAVLCFDIGCNGNMADKINSYVFKGLHGRVIPAAAGIKLANQKLPVIAVAGDGGTFDEGMQHFIHAFRSNYDITFVLHNNCDFGLTTGQATPTTPKGQKMNSSPYGVIEDRLNPTQLALNLNPSFVAKGYTGDMKQLKALMISAIEHKGFSYLEVLQHCPTYNKFMDQTWYKDRVYKVEEDESYDNSDLKLAYERAEDQLEKIATGILYQDKARLNFYQRLEHLKAQLELVSNVEEKDIGELLNEFK
ncbi:2-oxoacid:ferredoxin oxidoreductase subunit beta [Candidatus Dojkabacteria bacterium]|nr:2-oxoacid:ferredoxin oxidoreductase subunit beta [Candidatus Dojkabacteria bacterium]